jgi:iron-sulfur cluster repair protein YtfE (RIC family)
MEKVCQSHAPPPQHPKLKSLQTVFENLLADLEPHLLNEERVLFLLIVKLDRDTRVANASHNSGQFGSSVMNLTREQLKEMAKGYVAPEDDGQSFCYKRVPLKIAIYHTAYHS